MKLFRSKQSKQTFSYEHHPEDGYFIPYDKHKFMIEKLKIAYQGIAVEQHQIDVTILAPSLLNFAAVFSEAQKVINRGCPDKVPSPKLEIVASPQAGSFWLQLFLDSNIVPLLTNPYTQDLLTAKSLFDAVCEAVNFLKRIGENREKISNDSRDGTYYKGVDGETLYVPIEASALLETKQFRLAIGEAYAPLGRQGFEEITLTDANTRRGLIVTKADYQLIKEEPSKEIHTNNKTVRVSIEQVSFDSNKGWKLREDDDIAYQATLEDDEFRNKILSGEISFTSGDEMEIELLEKQIEHVKKRNTEHFIVKVLQYYPRAK